MEKKLFTSIRAGVSEHESCSVCASNGGTRKKRRSLMHSLFAGLLFWGCLMAANTVKAQDYVMLRDTLRGNMHLTLAQSSHYVSGNVVVPEGVTLTIDPSVELQFLQDAKITVLGTMTGSGFGMKNATTIFSGNSWKTLQIGNETTAGTFNAENLLIRRGGTENGMISVVNGTAAISGMTTESAEGPAIYMGGGTLNLTGDIAVASAVPTAAVYSTGGTINLNGNLVKQGTLPAVIAAGGALHLNGGTYSGYHAVQATGGSVTLNGANLNATVGNALVISNAGATVHATNTVFTAHEGNPASPAAINFLASGNLTWGTGNSINDLVGIVALRFTTVGNNFVLPKIPIPYQMEQPITVNQGGSFSLSAGNTLKIDKTGTFNIRGEFSANGTSANQIAINKTTAGNAFEVNDGGTLNLTYSNLNTLSGIRTNNGTTNLTNSTLDATAGNALIIGHENAEIFLAASTVTASDKDIQYLAGGDIEFDAQSSLTGSNTVYTFEFSALNSEMNLTHLPKPIALPNGFTVNTGGIWNIASGNIINGGLINVRGTLNAVAPLGEQIIFTSTAGAFALQGGTLNLDGANITAATTAGLNAATGTANIDHSIFTVTLGDGIILNGFAVVNVQNTSWNLSTTGFIVNFNAGANLHWLAGNAINGGRNYIPINFSQVNNYTNFPYIPLPYVRNGSLQIATGNTLNIESKNTIKCSGWIDVYGTLLALAEEGEKILFTSYNDDNAGGDTNNGTPDTPTARSWGGIEFRSTSNNSHLSGCEIRFGGGANGYYGAVYFENASPTVEKCNLNTNYYGFDLRGVSNPVLRENTISASTVAPVAMTFESNPVFTNNVLGTSDNTYDAIALFGGSISQDAHIVQRHFTNVPNITYVMLDQIEIPAGKTLIVDSGIVIKSIYYDDAILVKGALKVNGTPDAKVVFTSVRDDMHGNPMDTEKNGNGTTPATGNWAGIIFENSADDANCLIQNSIIKYASMNNRSYNNQNISGGAITIIDASPTVRNVQIQNANYGLYAFRGSNPMFENIEILNSSTTSTPVAQSFTANPTYANVNFTNPGIAALGIIGETVGVSGHLTQKTLSGYENITYTILADVIIPSGVNVTVDEGIVIKPLDGNVDIFVDGGLKFAGTTENPVIYTSLNDDSFGNPQDTKNDGNATIPAAGNWGSIWFRATADDAFCEIDNAKIMYGGNNSYNSNYSPVIVVDAAPVIKNTVISGGRGHGIISAGIAAPVLTENVIIQNQTGHPMAMSLTATPVTAANSPVFNTNASNGIYILQGTYAGDAHLTKRAVNGLDNIPYVVANFTIGADATFTVDKGIIFKFEDWDHSEGWQLGMVIDGAMRAVGTESEPIVFTSILDDSRGGDTNLGSKAPVVGSEWGSIRFNNSSLKEQNLLKHCLFNYSGLYAGTTSYYYGDNDKRAGSVMTWNSKVVIDNCKIENSYWGVGIYGTSNPVITNNQFVTITVAPVYMSMFANPTFSGNTVQNAGDMAIAIHPETYTQDGVMPKRNFAGYENITYLAWVTSSHHYVINSGVTVTIPAGIVFKGARDDDDPTFEINGKLIVAGTESEPVIFTHEDDDRYGNPLDTRNNANSVAPVANNTWIYFNPQADDESVIDHAIFAYSNRHIAMESAAPTITNCTFKNANSGIDLYGQSAPRVDNCTFDNLTKAPIYHSLASQIVTNDNETTHGNQLVGTTYKVFGVVANETVAQNDTLRKITFAGINNIPYFFNGNFTVGSSATLYIEPGVVCKFTNDARFTVQRGLIALGGPNPEEKIIFTSYWDDFYGGDSNSDGKTEAQGWYGIRFDDSSVDASCRLDNCVIRYARLSHSGIGYGLEIQSASPTITNTVITECEYGIVLRGGSNPVINYCDIYNFWNDGLLNVNQAYNIDATNCWWGNNSGPTHASNPSGTGATVSDMVNYMPFRTQGTAVPIPGDVSLNGIVQAYDASLILQHTVSNIILTAEQLSVADVSGDGSVGALDAAYILQFVAGITQTFPVQLRSGNVQAEIYSKGISQNENIITVPVYLAYGDNIYGVEWTLSYDKAVLRPLAVNAMSDKMFACRIDEEEGKIHIALADAENIGNALAQLQFDVIADNYSSTYLTTEKLMINESDFLENANAIEIPVQYAPTGIDNVFADGKTKFEIGNGELHYTVSENTNLIIAVYNVSGQLISMPVNKNVTAGEYSVSLGNLAPGVYIIHIQAGKNVETKKVVLK